MADLRVKLPDYSMFAATPLYSGIGATVDGESQQVAVFGLMSDVIVPDSSDIIYRVPQSGVERLDLIANKFYGVPDLWWVIARVNRNLDPLVGFAANQQIRVPRRERLAAKGILSV